ncbi:MAG: hypothetical protein JO225_14640 [Candidatus Eremiobacteraeota bacterium]|nr:hypothetical protein [Candidatus Eremiobacteraeota bacterium]MBV8645142.1 hypothetical protein [Candidatus Eremiobacteraeota bacterium]
MNSIILALAVMLALGTSLHVPSRAVGVHALAGPRAANATPPPPAPADGLGSGPVH